MRWSTKELNKEFIEELSRLQERFDICSSKGCLPRLFRHPVNLEPHLLKPYPGQYNRNTKDIVISKVVFSTKDEVTPETSVLFFDGIRGLQEPVSFEVIGSRNRISIQIVAQRRDRRIITHATRTTYPHSYLERTRDLLFTNYKEITSNSKAGTKNLEFSFNDYYLPPPYYFSLNSPSRDFSLDLLESLFRVFSKLTPEELGFYQVLFIPTTKWDWTKLTRTLLEATMQREEYVMKNTWFENIYNPIPLPTKVPAGEEFHPVLDESDLKEHTAKAYEKTKDQKPFFAVSLRVGLFTHKGKAEGILKLVINALSTLMPGDRKFLFLTRKDYFNAGVSEKLHYYMFFNRVSLREGMLLTSKELAGLVHFPTRKTLEKGYPIDMAKGKHSAPDYLTSDDACGTVIGESQYRGKTKNITLAHKQRAKHLHIIGLPGYGKSTFIGNCVLQDIKQGTGVCVIDPHGDLIENSLLPRIPEEFTDKEVYFDPQKAPVKINILEATNKKERGVLANDIVSIFKRLSDTWGVQLEEILTFGVLAILSSKEGGHLGTLHRFLNDKEFRKEYLSSIEDDFVVQFWREQFPQFPKGAAIPVLRRLNQFLASPILREIVSHEKSAINFRDIMDEGKVFLVNLPLGDIGTVNAYMLGSLIISRLHAAALSRQDIPEEKRKPFYLYVDEFQNFMCASIEECLTGTRKYALGLILAHQSLSQILERDRSVANAVLEIPNIRICFRVGDDDSVILAKGFLHYEANELRNLAIGEAVVRVEGSANDFEIKTHYEPPQVKDVMRNEDPTYYSSKISIANDLSSSAKKDSESKRMVMEKEETHLPLEEKRFLESIAGIKEVLPLREVYKELKVGVSKGERLKTLLIQKRLITETEIHLKKAHRNSKILSLTPRAYRALGFPLPSGKGGPLHQYLQELIAHDAKTRGYKAIIEARAHNGKLVDVGLTNDGENIAVEISVTTSPDQILQNIKLDLEGGFKKVLVVCIDTETLNEARKLAKEKLSKDEAKGVRFCLAGEVEEELHHSIGL